MILFLIIDASVNPYFAGLGLCQGSQVSLPRSSWLAASRLDWLLEGLGRGVPAMGDAVGAIVLQRTNHFKAIL